MLYEVSKLYVSPLDVNNQRIDTCSIFLGKTALFGWGCISSMHKLSLTTMVINGSSNRSSIMKGPNHFKRTEIVAAFMKQIELNI